MAKGPNYRVFYRRRRKGKTDYRKRLKLVLSGKPRIVIRHTTKNTIVEIVETAQTGDRVCAYAHSKQLEKLGWKFSGKNLPSAYLTGYLCAKRALKKGVKEAVLDYGLFKVTKGSRIFSALKGAIDAGVFIPHDEKMLPNNERVRGEHIKKYFESLPKEKAEKLFSGYIKNGIETVKIVDHFEKTKKRIDEII